MNYEFKWGPELIWAVLTTVATVIAAAITSQGAMPPDNIGTWLIGVAAAAVRAVLGALMGVVSDARV